MSAADSTSREIRRSNDPETSEGHGLVSVSVSAAASTPPGIRRSNDPETSEAHGLVSVSVSVSAVAAVSQEGGALE